MKLFLAFIAVFCFTLISGCILPSGQYSSVVGGVEINRDSDGVTRVNVSGNAKVTMAADGSLVAESNGNDALKGAMTGLMAAVK